MFMLHCFHKSTKGVWKKKKTSFSLNQYYLLCVYGDILWADNMILIPGTSASSVRFPTFIIHKEWGSWLLFCSFFSTTDSSGVP